MNWHQLQTILWLRWRLSKNQLTRGGSLNAIIAVLLIALGVLAALGGFVGGIFGGLLGLAKARPPVMLLVWDILIGFFLFFWMIGIMTEIQRSETIDLTKLLHLPVSLRQVFVVNYVASHFTVSIILVVPPMVGLCIGLAFGVGPTLLLLLPLVLGFLFMVTAWTYCLRGWLIALMVNKRRRRAIIVGLTMAIIIIGQLPNIVFNSPLFRDSQRRRATMRPPQAPPQPIPESTNPSESAENFNPTRAEGEARTRSVERRSQRDIVPETVIKAHVYVPPGWVGYGGMALKQGNVWPAVWGTFGACLIGSLGLLRAYQLTNRFYQGKQSGSVAKPKPVAKVDPKSRGLSELELPGISAEASAMAAAFLRSTLRAPEVKMALLTPLIMLVVFGSMQLSRRSGTMPEAAKPFLATGAVAISLLGLVQLMSNQFGFDRDGFRALVLSPVRRQDILLAKNLCFLPFVTGIGLIFMFILKLVLSLSIWTLLAGALQLGAAFLAFSVVGNFVSIIAPYRIAAGSLKPTKTDTKTSLLIFALHLLFPVVLLPVCVPPGLETLFTMFSWLPGVPINFLASVGLLALMMFFYRLSLNGLGSLLQRREKDILQKVTHEVE
jgi:hypothetical protein